jgi:hypothetical protein
MPNRAHNLANRETVGRLSGRQKSSSRASATHLVDARLVYLRRLPVLDILLAARLDLSRTLELKSPRTDRPSTQRAAGEFPA